MDPEKDLQSWNTSWNVIGLRYLNHLYETLAKTDVGSVFFHAIDMFPNSLERGDWLV